MSIRYKINVLDALKKAGYNTNRLRIEKLLSEGTIQSLRHEKKISFDTINTICKILNCQPGDIIEYVKD